MRPFYGQHSYLGSGSTSWPLVDKTSDDFGIAIELTWFTRPRKMTLVTSEREVELDRPVAPAPVTVEVDNSSRAESEGGDGILDDVTKKTTEIGDAAVGWPPILQIGAVLTMLGIIVIAIMILRRRK